MVAATGVLSRRGTDQFRGLFSDTFSVVATLSPSSLAGGAAENNSIAVPGAKLGDIVLLSFAADITGFIFEPFVSSSNVVTIRFRNDTAGTLQLASSTVRCVVLRMV